MGSPSLLLIYLFSFLCFISFCLCASTTVTTATELQAAVNSANPGDIITLADNTVFTFSKDFTISRSGTESQRITLTGSATSVIACASNTKNYVLHIEGASYITVSKITFRTGKKGIVVDKGSYNVLDALTIYDIGEEAVHFRDASSYNVIQNSNIHDVGVNDPRYGEGVYVGSDGSKWGEFDPACDHTQILNNILGPNIAAEPIDIKEGSSFTFVKGNIFNASGIQGQNSADSWMDVKGNNCTITENTGYQAGVVDPLKFADGFQTHQRATGWGYGNVFSNNIGFFESSFTGYLIMDTVKASLGYAPNIICNNNAVRNGGGVANVLVSACPSSTTSSTSSTSTSSPTSTSSSPTSSTSTSSTSSTSDGSTSSSPSSTSSSSTTDLPDGAGNTLVTPIIYCFVAVIVALVIN